MIRQSLAYLASFIHMRYSLDTLITGLASLSLFFGALGGGVAPACAGIERGQELPRAQLLGIARLFVDKVGTTFDKKQNEIDAAAALAAEQNRNELEFIADGDTLIFQMQIGRTLRLKGDLLSEKSGENLLVSFRDFLNVMYFPIVFDAAAGKAEGWYITEDKVFRIDYPAGTVLAQGSESRIPDSVRRDKDDLMVPVEVLESWFDLSLKPKVSELLIYLDAEDMLPLEARLARRDRNKPEKSGVPEPQLPRRDVPRKLLDFPNTDISLNYRFRDPPEGAGERTKLFRTTAIASGDIAYHTGRLFVTGDSKQNVTSVRMSIEDDSDDAELLGPLKARRYEVGDISPTQIPLIGSAPQQWGGRATNRKQGQATSSTTTRMEGDLPPGWDVELYRNGQLVDFLTVGDDGRYVFDDVQLFAGKNDFKLKLYGLQGEVRTVEKSIPVDLRRLIGNEQIYDVSLTFDNRVTFQRDKSEPPEDGTPHFAALYEHVFSDNLTGLAGVEKKHVGENEKLLGLVGVSANIYDSLVNANLGFDVDGEAGLELTSRRNIGRHRLRVDGFLGTDEFNPEEENDNPITQEIGFSARGPLASFDRHKKVNYGGSIDYKGHADGAYKFSANQNLNSKINRLSVNQGLRYTKSTLGDDDKERLTGTLGINGKVGKAQWRTLSSYDFTPDSGLNSSIVKVGHPIGKKLDIEGQYEYRHKTSFSEATVKANMRTDDFILTPQLSLDSEDEMVATIGARFGTAIDPRTNGVEFSSKRTANSGSVSAFVYVDANGDYTYTEGEEKVEGAKIEAIQGRRRAYTEADGIAFMSDLFEYQATDIVLDTNTLKDPYWIPAFEGISIRPRPGIVSEVDFPVHIAGEIDGTVYYQGIHGREGARGVHVSLYDSEGRKLMSTRAAYDGFYLFSLVPPGQYYLMFDAKELADLGLTQPVPAVLDIGYDGTVLYGQDIFLESTTESFPVGFEIVADYDSYADRHAHISFPALEKNSVVLNFGTFRSHLMKALVWYDLRRRYGAILGESSVLVPPSQSLPGLEDNAYRLRVNLGPTDIAHAHKKCRALAARGFSCSVEILPRGFEGKEI